MQMKSRHGGFGGVVCNWPAYGTLSGRRRHGLRLGWSACRCRLVEWRAGSYGERTLAPRPNQMLAAAVTGIPLKVDRLRFNRFVSLPDIFGARRLAVWAKSKRVLIDRVLTLGNQ